ncbi:MAG TPA: hypothetical protein PLZ52_03260 [Bacteroidales bacterium]|nr:hypothetical protein [Bacteroidales bacterium]
MENNSSSNKKDVFKVPEGYFDSLPGRVSENITAKAKNVSPRWIDIVKPYLYFAAAFFMLGVFIKIGLTLMVDKDKLHQSPPVVPALLENTIEVDELIADDVVFYETIELLQDGDAIEAAKIENQAIEDYLLDYDMIAELTE